ARIDGCAVDRAAEQLLIADQPMTRVEEQTAEHLVRQIEQPCFQESRRILGCGERAARLERCAEVTPAELQCGCETRDASGPQAAHTGELRRSAAEQCDEAAALDEQRTCELGRRSAARAGTEQDREQLAVGQRLGSRLEQPLAGPFREGPAAWLHVNPFDHVTVLDRRAAARAKAAAISPR